MEAPDTAPQRPPRFLGPYSSPMPRDLLWSLGEWVWVDLTPHSSARQGSDAVPRLDFGFWVSGFGFRVSGFGFRVAARLPVCEDPRPLALGGNPWPEGGRLKPCRSMLWRR